MCSPCWKCRGGSLRVPLLSNSWCPWAHSWAVAFWSCERHLELFVVCLAASNRKDNSGWQTQGEVLVLPITRPPEEGGFWGWLSDSAMPSQLWVFLSAHSASRSYCVHSHPQACHLLVPSWLPQLQEPRSCLT